MAQLNLEERKEQLKEARLRAKAKRMGYSIRKSRRGISLDNHGEFMIVDASTNFVVRGEKYDWTLDDIEQFLTED